MFEYDATVDELIGRISARRVDAVATLELLSGYTAQVEASRASLENPQAIQEYLRFFTEMVNAAIADCQRIAVDLTTEGIRDEHVSTLRQIASNCAVEQRRCLIFRDKWINKPLPYETMRALLNDISVTTRDQLTAFYDLNNIAASLEEMLKAAAPPPRPEEKRGLGRRELFTRLFKS